jgi:SRSO17 transposase
MLPDIRQSDYLYNVPKFELDRNAVADMAGELKGFHENFADCFLRSESRDNFYRCMSGRFNQLERKSIEPVAFSIEGANVRAMQRFVSDAPWDDENIMRTYRGLVSEDLGHPDGAIGKVDNCQVGVFAAYLSVYGYALIDKRLHIPEKWFADDYRLRRENGAGAGRYTLPAQASEDNCKDLPISRPGAGRESPCGWHQ